ncbi:MAG: hypothetical protein QOJ92_2994 [Frankiales bacterium]|nr:hypothetical protein [Frankiales bacterium]
MRGRWALVAGTALVAVTGCTSSGSSTAEPTQPPSPSATASAAATATAAPSATPTPPAVSVLVALERSTGALEVYRVDSARHALRQRLMGRPAKDYRPSSIAFAAASNPTMCVTWQRVGHEDADGQLLCYAPGAFVGHRVAGVPHTPTAVALRADGKALAWTESAGDPSYQMDLLVGDFDGNAVRNVRRIAYDPSCPPSKGEECLGFLGVGALAWVGTDAVALSVGGESDEGSGLRVMRLDPASTAKGWLKGSRQVPVPKADRDRQFYAYDNVVSATTTTALAVERANLVCCDGGPPARAVRLNLTTGAVLEVVAVPATGREAMAVSGDHAVLYVTQSNRGTDRKVYLRLPGEAHGLEVTGLPSGVATAVLQAL